MFLSMHKSKIYVSQSVMYAMPVLVVGCLYHPDQTIFFFFPVSIYICVVPKGEIWDDK